MLFGEAVKGETGSAIAFEAGDGVGIDTLMFGTEGDQLLLSLLKTVMIEDGVEFQFDRLLLRLRNVAKHVIDLVNDTALALGVREVIVDGILGRLIAVTDP